MDAVSPESITRAAMESFAATPDPRLMQIATALVRHLHRFVTEVAPSQEEWGQAIAFLTRVGQMCQGARQEFILLSDVLGVSMLVDALNHGAQGAVTESTVLGPFYVDAPPLAEQGVDIAAGAVGEPLSLDLRVVDPAGLPLAGAVVDIWQCDGDGLYDVQRADLDHHRLRARLHADAAGRVRCRSVMPVAYAIPDDGPVGDLLAATGRHPWRPAHIHFRIEADGHAPLVTHLFAQGGPYLDSDAVFGVKPSLIVEMGQGVGTGGESSAAFMHSFVLAKL